MNSLNLKRLTQYTKAELNANKKQLIIMLATVAIISSTIYALIYITTSDFHMASALTAFTTMVITAFSISVCFKKYFNRSRSVETIMIPVSKSEKFTFNALFYAIIFPLATLLVYVFISWCWSLAYNFNAGSAILGCQHTVKTILNMFTGASIFFYGAILFKRNQFILTCLSIGAIMLLLSLLVISQSNLTEMINNFASSITARYITYIVLILFFGTMSWVRFKKLQTA